MRVTCPGCSRATDLTSDLPVAESFCKNCDYPLFWAIPEDAVVDADGTVAGRRRTLDPTLRRMPGTVGRDDVLGIACPNPDCEEMNPRDGIRCVRCLKPLHPVAEPEPDPDPDPEPEPEPEPEPPFPIGWVIAAVVGVLVLLVTALVWGAQAVAVVALFGAAAAVAVAWPRLRP